MKATSWKRKYYNGWTENKNYVETLSAAHSERRRRKMHEFISICTECFVYALLCTKLNFLVDKWNHQPQQVVGKNCVVQQKFFCIGYTSPIRILVELLIKNTSMHIETQWPWLFIVVDKKKEPNETNSFGHQMFDSSRYGNKMNTQTKQFGEL